MKNPNFHLVVTCVGKKHEYGRKVRLAAPVDKNTIDAAFVRWVGALRGAPGERKAKDVYMGATWNAALNAFAEIDANRFEPHLWIVSCGYGLIRAEDEIAAYGLTFKSGELDSLSSGNPEGGGELAKKWWGKLMADPPINGHRPSSLNELINGMGGQDLLLMAAGVDYYNAVVDDLAMANDGILGKQCCFICKPDIAGDEKAGNLLKGKIVTWAENGHDSLVQTLKKEFGHCNNTQILNRSAQYLIRHFVNKGVVLSDWPGILESADASATDKGGSPGMELNKDAAEKGIVWPSAGGFKGGVREIREWVWNHILQPNYQNLPCTLRAGDVHKHLGLHAQMVQVCDALRGMPKDYPVLCTEKRGPNVNQPYASNIWFTFSRRVP